MTCIAWDGKTLAADKRTNSSGIALTTCKVHLTPDGLLVAGAGDTHVICEMHGWFDGGRDPEKFPTSQKGDNFADFLCIDKGRILIYGKSPTPFEVLDEKAAIGSGRDFALAAMHLGKSAPEAVAVACHFSTSCGNGIDSLELQ
jgi:hypothetical protein